MSCKDGSGSMVYCLTCKYADNDCCQLPCANCVDGSEFVSHAVNHPKHYQGKYECIDEMIAMFGVEAVKHFCMCNVYKYRFRAARKNGEEDIKKAEWYMEYLMRLNEND